MALITIPNTFSSGAVIVASQHNSNFSVIASDYNGNIDNTNVSTSAAISYSKLNLATSIVNADVNASAAIAYSKLNLTGNIINADINASASIVDSKLAQITTASKVSGTAITGLASLPVGAGVIPVANIPSIGITFISATAFSAGNPSSGNITINKAKMYLVKIQFTSSSATPSIILNGDTSSGQYGYVYRGFSHAASALNGNSTSANFISTGTAITASTEHPFQLEFVIYPQATASTKYVYIKGFGFGQTVSSGDVMSDFSGKWNNSADVTSFAFRDSAGSDSGAGTVYLYSYALS